MRQNLVPVEQSFNTKRTTICRLLAEMCEPLSTQNIDLTELLEQGDALIKRHDELSQKRTNLETRLATARTELTNAELSTPNRECRFDRLANRMVGDDDPHRFRSRGRSRTSRSLSEQDRRTTRKTDGSAR